MVELHHIESRKSRSTGCIAAIFDYLKGRVSGADDLFMDQEASSLTRRILDLYKEGHSPGEIGQIVAQAETRVLFALQQLDALTPEHSKLLDERMKVARLVSTRSEGGDKQQEIEPKENLEEEPDDRSVGNQESIRQSDEDIQAEMMAAQFALTEQFGMETMARGTVGKAARTVRAALDHGFLWNDALKFGRAVMLNTVKVERPRLLPPEGVESIGRTIEELAEKYGDDTLGDVIDEVQAWAQANE